MVIAITNQKGGVGKTTTAVNMAAGLQRLGYKVLLVDTDPQCNSTDTYRAEIDGRGTLYDILCTDELAAECIQHTEAGDIIPSDPLLKDAEQRMPADSSRCFVMREKLDPIVDYYDYVIIDTPPTLGVILSNVLTLADELIVPVTCDRYGLQGIDQLVKTIKSAKRYTNPKIRINGMLLIKYARRQKLCREISDKLEPIAGMMETRVYQTRIRETAACRIAQSQRMNIFEYDEKCNTALDYSRFVKELLEVSHGKESRQ